MDSAGEADTRSESKGLVGDKRKAMEDEETCESSHKSFEGEARKGVEEDESKRFKLDLNAVDTSTSLNFEHVKSRSDSVRVWEGLKRNNYMSAPRGVVIPKTRRKKRDNAMKKKMELARKEEIDRFAKVAAPSGLLNGLNPGIITQVRNSKQVKSIIQNLVRSEIAEKNTRMSAHANIMNKDDHDELELKLSSSRSCTLASENASCMSNDESGNLNSVTSLSSKAANVASQWLELLNQDINGRLSALRHSKKRVRNVINKELPQLTLKELSSTDKSHADRWSSLFEKMEKSLSEEETILENWLNEVNKMQLHCERGLSNISEGTAQMGNNGLWEWDKDLAVRAAAASIYSTCNFLLTMGNQLHC